MGARDYGTITPAFWTGETGLAMRGLHEAQALAAYLMTSPHTNMIGLFPLPMAYMADDLGMTEPVLKKAIAKLQQLGFAKYDSDARMMWVVNLARYQIGPALTGADNRKLRILRELETVKKHPFAQEFFDRYAEPYGLLRPAWLPPPFEGGVGGASEGVGKGSAVAGDPPSKPIQDQDHDHCQDHDHDHDHDQEHSSVHPPSKPPTENPTEDSVTNGKSPKKKPSRSDDVRTIFDHWALCRKAKHPRGDPKLDADRTKVINARLDDGYSVQVLCDAVEGIWMSRWNLGENDRGTEYTDIRHAIGSGTNVDKFAETAQKVRDLHQKSSARAKPAAPIVPEVAKKPDGETQLALVPTPTPDAGAVG